MRPASRDRKVVTVENGVIAQMGERLNGIQEVDGSIPSGSTKLPNDYNELSAFGRFFFV